MKMLIAIPQICDESDFDDEWDMLMRDLRDDVPRVADMPACTDANPTIETLYGRRAFVYRFDVDDDLGQQLLSSAYANTSDLVIEKAA